MAEQAQAHSGRRPALKPLRVIDAILAESELTRTIKKTALPARSDSPEEFAVILPTLITATYLHIISDERHWQDIPRETLGQVAEPALREEWLNRISALEIPLHTGNLRTEIVEPDAIIDALTNIIPEPDNQEQYQKVAMTAKTLLRGLKNKAKEILTGNSKITTFSGAIRTLRESALQDTDRETALLTDLEKTGLLGVFKAYSGYLTVPDEKITDEGRRKMEMAQSSIHILQNYWIWKELGHAKDTSLTFTVIEPLRNFIEAVVTYNLEKIHHMIAELSHNDETSAQTTLI